MALDPIDSDDPTTIDWPERQARAIVPFKVVNGRPRNPHGAGGGKRGRGDLWLWGENQAADPIVVTHIDSHPHVLLIDRDDDGGWAIPGGMADPGETYTDTLVRELREETGVDVGALTPMIVSRGYVRDPRNTANAWICSTAAVFHVPHKPQEIAGDDARAAGWFRFGSLDELRADVHRHTGGQVYPAHWTMLLHAADLAQRLVPGQPTWAEMFPDGRGIYYEANDRANFARRIRDQFAFDVTADPEWNKDGGWAFHCPAEYLDAIYGGRWTLGS